jgi:hypothetical protein
MGRVPAFVGMERTKTGWLLWFPTLPKRGEGWGPFVVGRGKALARIGYPRCLDLTWVGLPLMMDEADLDFWLPVPLFWRAFCWMVRTTDGI